jgi:hypothetical protein
MVAMSKAMRVGAAAWRARAALGRKHAVAAVVEEQEAAGKGFRKIRQEGIELLIEQLAGFGVGRGWVARTVVKRGHTPPAHPAQHAACLSQEAQTGHHGSAYRLQILYILRNHEKPWQTA